MSSTGADLRGSADWQEAVEVTRLTMSRVRTNVERLLELLPQAGYELASEPGLPVFEAPPADIGHRLDDREARVGPLPLSLRRWYEQVGRVNLVGAHPEWEYDYPDPLVVDAPIDFVLSEYADWRAQRGTESDRGAGLRRQTAPERAHRPARRTR